MNIILGPLWVLNIQYLNLGNSSVCLSCFFFCCCILHAIHTQMSLVFFITCFFIQLNQIFLLCQKHTHSQWNKITCCKLSQGKMKHEMRTERCLIVVCMSTCRGAAFPHCVYRLYPHVKPKVRQCQKYFLS